MRLLYQVTAGAAEKSVHHLGALLQHRPELWVRTSGPSLVSKVWSVAEGAGSGLTCDLAAAILARSGLACPSVCGRRLLLWLLVWLLESATIRAPFAAISRR